MSGNVVRLADWAQPMTSNDVRDFLAEYPLWAAGIAVLWGDQLGQLLAITSDPIRAVLAADEIVRRQLGGDGLLKLCNDAVSVDGSRPFELLERSGQPVRWRPAARASSRTVLACLIYASPDRDGA